MTIQLKRNDTKDVISYKLTYPNGDTVNLTGAKVNFVMGKGKTLITDSVAKIVSATAGEVEYQLTDADTAYAGTFHAEFEVTFSDGKIKTFPNKGYISVTIQPNIDSDKTTAVEDSIALRVSEIEIFKTDVNTKVDKAVTDAAKVTEIQAQVNQLVVDGDSSVEAAQARVQSNGNSFSTLRDRLNASDAQLAQTETELKQTDKVIEQRKEIANVLIEPLNINTFDGTNQPIHPSVYYNSNKWNGKKFWMAYTPLPIDVPPYEDRWESPCIVSSDNGVDWIIPLGAPDPLVDLTTEEINRGDYFSDTCIVMNGNTMEVWYRHTNGANTDITNIFRVTSTNGVNWSSPEKVLDVQETDNGFGDMQTMRTQQLFFDGSKYTAYFTLQGGLSGVYKAESTDPSSRKWTNLTRLSFIGSPGGGFYVWHFGLIKVGNKYHMTAYDPENNAIQLFASDDGLSFTFVNSILKGDKTAETAIFDTLYQSVPVKVNDYEWLLYASGTFKHRKRGIVLYRGKTLENLVPVSGSQISRSMHFDASPTLNNNPSRNGLYYLTYADHKNQKFNGYRMLFGNIYNVPAWYGNDKSNPIVHVIDDMIAPYVKPEFVGMIWRDVNTKNMWISVGTSDLSDWRSITSHNSGIVVNKQRKNATASPNIDVLDTYRLVIHDGSSTTITNLTSPKDGQELWVLNATFSANMTLQHGGTGSGKLLLRNAQNVVLKPSESISLICVGSVWYQK